MTYCFRVLVLASALFCWCIAGHAQTYPNRPIRVIIPYAPAGGADIIGRLVLDQVSKDTGYNFIVENRVGAGGNIAFAAIASGQPDGYTLVIATPGLATNPTLYSKLSFSPADFTAITVIGESPLVFMVNPALPVASIAEFIGYARKSAQPLRFGSAGNGRRGFQVNGGHRTATHSIPRGRGRNHRRRRRAYRNDHATGGREHALHRGQPRTHSGPDGAGPLEAGGGRANHRRGWRQGLFGVDVVYPRGPAGHAARDR